MAEKQHPKYIRYARYVINNQMSKKESLNINKFDSDINGTISGIE